MIRLHEGNCNYTIYVNGSKGYYISIKDFIKNYLFVSKFTGGHQVRNILQGLYYNAIFLNIPLGNYLFVVSCYERI